MELKPLAKSKRAQLGGLYSGILIVGSIGILIALMLYIFTQIGESLPDASAAQNATASLSTQFVDFIPWIGIVLLVLAAGTVLFFVIRSFSGGGTRGA